MSRTSIIVTGGAGFIGSELVRQLTAEGSPVVVIDNLVNGKRENLADEALHREEADARPVVGVGEWNEDRALLVTLRRDRRPCAVSVT